ncbi:golgin subfamily A member 4 isoform X1 [Carassius gibelio]|uniref:golgin subfamily A member 4 isoform X1 n=1 Tax=Carassius gibelio TaxID=101364 RepID=UPI00227795B5|nr:golgin subfamily A member 4 isoform X1 [Carassius gibelio]XP_052386817.1 golgin subfamily A member 4 isoform X1 [Carassius gibelio]XP_052386818.1 golgin subfamily A member 4 isoform X1 [Carassius gibelio]XP_052386819.1 golgin subfamily A member 4 isoform X1 [Carassius gibelio]
MLRWFSAEESSSAHGAPGSPQVDMGSDVRFTEVTEQLTQMEELVANLKELIREKDAALSSKDNQVKELTEQMQHLRGERENFQSKLEAERHISRARIKDLMEKHEAELLRAADKHEVELSEKEQALRRQLETLQRSISQPADASANLSTCITAQRVTELQAQVKLKQAEASKAEAKFLKMKAWSKSRIRQLEEDLKKVQSGLCIDMSPDVTSLHSRITELQEEREEILSKLELYEDMKAKNDFLETSIDELQKQLMEYKEQQRKMQADLEQVTNRAASQVSETGSMDDVQVMEWQEMITMVTEAERVQHQGHEKNVMAFRMSHIEEEREALANRQQEVEEELAQARGLCLQKSRKPKYFTPRSLQEDLEYHNRQDPIGDTDCDVFVNGENMGGWWPQHSAAVTDGLRSVVEELELERNQLQEQILVLEKQCQDLEDRLQLQARIELLQATFGIDEGDQALSESQNESERLQAQVASLRSQQIKDTEKHQLLIASLNKQLKGLSSTQECLESSLMEKEHTLARTSVKLEYIDSLREALETKEKQNQETTEKLLQTEHNLAEVTKTCNNLEKENSEMKATVTELTLNLSVLKDKIQKQEATIESLQNDLVQTNDDLDRLNAAHLEERAQLVHDLQSCEREIDRLQDVIIDKDKDISALTSSTAEYSEQIHELKQEMKFKEDVLTKIEQDVQIFRDPELSDQQFFNVLIPQLIEQLKRTETDLKDARKDGESKSNEIKDLIKLTEEDKKSIQDLRMEIQKLNMNLKDQLLDTEQVSEKDSFQEERNQLLSEASKYKSELLMFSRKLAEQVECQEQLKQDLQDKSTIITSLEEKLKIIQEKTVAEREIFNKELKIQDEAKETLEKHLSDKIESIQSVNNNNQKLQESLEQALGELARQKQNLDNAKEQMQAVQDQNYNLLLQVESLTNDNCQLKREIEASVQSLSDVSEEKKSLASKISEVEQKLSESVKTIEHLQRDKEELTLKGNELSKELEQNKQSMDTILLEKDNIVRLYETLSRQNRQLEKMFEEKQKEVLKQAQVVSEMNNKVAITLEENEKLASNIASLDEQNKYLHKQTNETMKLLTETTKERENLQNKILIFEKQDMENHKIIEGLHKQNEDLLLQVEEHKNIEKNLQSGAETLQEKSLECAALSKCLRETKEKVDHLSRELESTTSQVLQYEQIVFEKEKTLTDQSTQMETYQHQLKQLQDSISILEEQANNHKLGLTEKETLLQKESNSCRLLQKELGHERDLVFTLQQELAYLKIEWSRLNQTLEVKESTLIEKNLECHNHSEELCKRNESVLSLTSQLGIMNENIVRLESDNAHLKGTLEEQLTENVRLKDELRQKQIEVVEHQDNDQAMNDQNIIIKSELKNLMTEKFRLQETIKSLQNELESNRVELASLAEQLKSKHSQFEALRFTLQGKEEVFRKQEMSVNKMNVRLLESESQITQKITAISELHEEVQNLQTALQEKDRLLLNKDKEFSLVEKTLMAQSESCEARLKSEMVEIAKVQRELKSLQEKNNHLVRVINENDSLLMQEKEKCLHLQGTASELENTVSLLTCQIERLTSEITQLRETQTEKELVTFATQSQMQKLDERYKQLQEEYDLTKQELLKVISEKSLKEEKIGKLVLEKEEICRNSSYQTERIQDQLQHHKWESSKVEEDNTMEREKPHILESMALQGKDASQKHWVQLHSHLQHCQREIQQRDFSLQQLNIKLQQAIEEKEGASSQLSTVSKMLRDSQQTVSELQNRCYWLQTQFQNQYSPTQGSVYTEVPPGAPQEPISANLNPSGSDSGDLRMRLAEAEFHLSELNSRLEEERSRREVAEEAVRLTEQRVQRYKRMESNQSWHSQRDFSIQLEKDEEKYESLVLHPSRHKGSGVQLCQRWLKGRSIHCCSKLLPSRGKSRYIFMGYLLMLHVLVFVCLSWSL